MPLGRILSRNIALMTELLPFDVRPKNATFMWSRAKTSLMLLILKTKLRNASVSALSTMSPWPWLSASPGECKGYDLLSNHRHRLTFNEVCRLRNIIADVSEDIVNVLLGFHENLERWVDVVWVSSVCVHQRVITRSRNHRHSAIQIRCHLFTVLCRSDDARECVQG